MQTSGKRDGWSPATFGMVWVLTWAITPFASGQATENSPSPTSSPQQPVDESVETAPMPPGAVDHQEEEVLVDAAASAGPSDATAEKPWRGMLLLLIVLLVVPLPFVVGHYVGRSLRMPDHAWKIGLVLCTIASATVIACLGWPPQLGPDLSGGVNLIYEMDESDGQMDQPVDIQDVIAALIPRVNPGGIKEVVLRKAGPDQVEIIIPKADDAEIARIKRKISTAGALEFRITANLQDPKGHREVIELARQRRTRRVEQDGRVVARWVGLDVQQFPEEVRSDLITRSGKRGEPEVLVMMDPQNVTGEYLATASRGVDETGRFAVDFSFNPLGSRRFARLTTDNQPIEATGFHRRLGIVLDDRLLSAPNLNEPITQGRGQISGNFSEEEIDFLTGILNAGSLPAALNKLPISEQTISPTLGADTVAKGQQAIILSAILVMVFMLFYYRFAGLVACLALAANLVLILAVMISVKAAFTLPGLAGLVLTVGMAVDANVLIFERIREEIRRGTALRMAIRNGFGRATTTIVDANLTTLITAVVLYWIGKDQIRGFAVVLILGILMSMYTAIFCSRLIFDLAERQRWLTKLTMMQLLGKTQIDFLRRRYLAATVSVVLILCGLAAVIGRGSNLLDIDFTGGTSVTVLFKPGEELPIDQVRQALTGQQDLPDVAVVGVGEEDRRYKIDTSNHQIAQVQTSLQTIFGERLQKNSMSHVALVTIPPKSPANAEGEAGTSSNNTPQGSGMDNQEPFAGGTSTTLTFAEPIKHDSLVHLFQETLDALNLDANFSLNNPNYKLGSELALSEWDLNIELDAEAAGHVLSQINQQMAGSPVFPASNNIGGKIASNMQTRGITALLASLLFIVGYIWLRFQRITFGLAAVVALVHDVLVTLGILALSAYLVAYAAPLAGVLLIDPFKISLPILTAFLTIIGYSLNDTIVVFDRIREVRGKSPNLTHEMINVSINQTLGRTILTSLTTLLVVVILYVMGGAGIHGFAFSLVVGVIVGTYSSIFVASPMLAWMSRESVGWSAKAKMRDAAR